MLFDGFGECILKTVALTGVTDVWLIPLEADSKAYNYSEEVLLLKGNFQNYKLPSLIGDYMTFYFIIRFPSMTIF